MSANLSKSILDRIRIWKNSPLTFVKEVIGAEPSSQQIELLMKIAPEKRITVRSGHGTGKDADASWIIWWFMATRPYAKVACTAPTSRQLNDILWSELSKWYRKSKYLSDEFVIQKDKIFHKSAPKEWWVRAISPSVSANKEDQAETLAGLHGDHLLIVVDEASGVEDPVYIPLEGAMTQEDNKVLLIGNMTKNKGYFWDTHYDMKLSKSWCRLHWDSRKSTNVSKDMIQYFADKYGEDSNVYRIRVMGEPPADDLESFIPLSWSMQCVGNKIDVDEDWPIYLSADIGRKGDDDSVCLPRRGNLVYPWLMGNYPNTTLFAYEIVHMFHDKEAELVAIDEVGVGGPVYDWLKTDIRGPGPKRMVAVNSTHPSPKPAQYHRMRDWLWSLAKEKCRLKLYSFPDKVIKYKGTDINLGQELANELASVRYGFNKANGAIKLESKDDMRARGVKSPNIGDSLVQGEYCYNRAIRQESRVAEEMRRKRRMQSRLDGINPRYRWMVA